MTTEHRPMDIPLPAWEQQQAAIDGAREGDAWRVITDVLGEAPAVDLPPHFARDMERLAYAERVREPSDRLETTLFGGAVALLCAVAAMLTPAAALPAMPAGSGWLAVAAAAVAMSALGWQLQRRLASP